MATCNSISTNSCRKITLALVLLFIMLRGTTQICSDASNVVYGLTNAGFLYPINVNTGVVGDTLNPLYVGNAPSQSNGVGYNSVNGKFYYFKRMPNLTPTEFVSFDATTNAVTILSSPVTSNAIYIGCVNNNGTGYYCWDSQARLFYYNIAADTWTMITSSIVDQFGKDVDSIFRAHGSGDAAIDGQGNLLMLPSSNTRFGLFRLTAPLPTTAVATVTVTQVQAMIAPPAKFVGIALNNTGQIYLNTSTDLIYRLENNLTLTLMSTLTLAMSDLTSCNFPLAMLPLSHNNFTANVKNDRVLLSWNNTETENEKIYLVQHSINNTDWKQVGKVFGNTYATKQISWTHHQPLKGKNYYRLLILSSDNSAVFSSVKTVEVTSNVLYAVWPNPVRNTLYIRNGEENNSFIIISDASGKKLKGASLMQGINNMDIGSLSPGTYIITIRSAKETDHSYSVIKN
jgi:hypothetical protein